MIHHQRYYSSIGLECQRRFRLRLCTFLSHCVPLKDPKRYHPSPLPLPIYECALVTRLDEVVCELLDGCCRVPCNHGLAIVSNEDSLLGLHDDDALPALGKN